MPTLSNNRRSQRVAVFTLLALAALGIAARFALSAISIGSADAQTWERFGRAVTERGVFALYAADSGFNHPPLMGCWSGLAHRVAQMTGMRFAFVFKLPVIGADVITCWLVWRIWRARGRSSVFAALIVALFAWNLDAILVSAFHCNTDSIYAMLVLLSVWLIDDKRAHFWGGLALGAAINIKLIPVIFILPMLATFRGRATAMAFLRFAFGLAIGALPFVPVIVRQGPSFARNALAYSSNLTDWGLPFLFMEAARRPALSAMIGAVADKFHDSGRWVMLGTIVLWSLYVRRRSASATIDLYRSCAVAASLFLALASGFGVQYTVIVVPLLMAAAPLVGTIYGVLAGAFLLMNYLAGWDGSLPILSWPASGIPIPGAPFGLLAWAALVVYIWGEVKRAASIPPTAFQAAERR